jgi:hypothetical protein
MVLESTQPVAEMSTRNLPGSKGQLVQEADNLNAICEPTVEKCGSLDVSQPYVIAFIYLCLITGM